MITFAQLMETMASGHSKRPADRDVGDKAADSGSNKYGRKIRAMHGTEDLGDENEYEGNYQEKIEKAQAILGAMKGVGGKDPMRTVNDPTPRGIKEGREGERDPDEYDKYSHSGSARERLMGKPAPMTTKQLRDRDRANHKFSDDIGGHSSNYKPVKEDLDEGQSNFADRKKPFKTNRFPVSDRNKFEREQRKQQRKEERKKFKFNMKEAFEPRIKYELIDGSTVTLDEQDAMSLNMMFAESDEIVTTPLRNVMMQNINEFKSVLELAQTLDEEARKLVCLCDKRKPAGECDCNAKDNAADDVAESAMFAHKITFKDGTHYNISDEELETLVAYSGDAPTLAMSQYVAASESKAAFDKMMAHVTKESKKKVYIKKPSGK